jgi:hypothetical protein
MHGDYRLVQMLHETRLREAAERRQHTERRRLAAAAARRGGSRDSRPEVDAERTGRQRSRRTLRPRLLAWASLPFTRR